MSVLRRSILKKIPKRGGGHDHPDFPFAGYYKHKRYISIFDTNMWVYDGMQPEYIVDQQLPYMTGTTMYTHNFILVQLAPILFGFFMGVVVYSNFKRPYRQTVIDKEDDNVRRVLKRFKEEKVFSRPHPLGHMHDYKSEGWELKADNWVYKKYGL